MEKEKQTIIFNALPNGRAADGSLNLSVFIAPRLWSMDEKVEVLELEKFGDFLDWSTRVASATWQVAFEDGTTLAANVVGQLPRPKLWSKLFTKDTDVLPYRFDNYCGYVVQTPQSNLIADFLEGIYVRAASDEGLGGGRNLPTIEALAKDPGILEIARPVQPRPTYEPPSERPDPIDLGGQAPKPKPTEPQGCGCCLWGCLLWPFALLAGLFPKWKPFLDKLFAVLCAWLLWPFALLAPLFPKCKPFFDKLLAALSGKPKTKSIFPIEPIAPPPPPAPPLPKAVPVGPGPASKLAPALPTLNQAAFNDLAAFIGPWTPDPIPVELPKEEEIKEKYDFHQMVSLLGDYPVLLRWFGLVVDLNVPLAGAVPPAKGTVKVLPTIVLTSLGSTLFGPRTHYTLTASGFGAKPRDDAPEISNGFLLLNPPSTFRVTQVDIVGGGTKLQNTATNILYFPTKESRPPTMPDTGSLPALRTAGISIIRSNTVDELENQFVRSRALQEFVATLDGAPQPVALPDAGPAPAPSDELFAEDLVRGYRIDVFDSQSQAWHSLCQRQGEYHFLEAPDQSVKEVKDEGFVQFSATEPLEAPDKPILRTSDSLFVWDGWSLCAPRPGLSIMPEPDPPPPEVKLEEIKNIARTNFRLETNFIAEPGSLPRLRFDYKYRLRARVCDLAGNSVVSPGKPGFLDKVDEETPEFPCARFEPVSPPALMMREAPVEGESLERLVVRTPAVLGTSPTTERHVIPPKISQLMAEQHGKFDGLHEMDSSDTMYQKAAREAGALTDGAIQVKKAAEAEASDVWIFPGEQYTVTYLPDPSARGVLLFNLPGMAPDQIIEPGGKIVNKIPFAGPWPNPIPFRIRLVGIPAKIEPAEPKWIEGGPGGEKSVLEIQLAESEKKVVRLSSYLQPEDLGRQGVWQWTEAAALAPGTLQLVKADTTAGRSWLHLPWRDITLVHAVLQPLEPPVLLPLSPLTLSAKKELGQTFATISGKVKAHNASTSKVDVVAEWKDPIDDLTLPKFIVREHQLPLCEVPIAEDAGETDLPEPKHNFGDTRHYKVTYKPVGTTRFREYFPESMTKDPVTQKPINMMKDGVPSDEVTILNSARPDAPKVLYVIPFYNWSEDPGATLTKVTRRRMGGLRVYLDRPWFSSGDGELLGVVYMENIDFVELNDRQKTVVTQWGVDPIWLSSPADTFATTENFNQAKEEREGLSLEEITETVSVAGYLPEYDEQRHLWFADILMNAGPWSYAPFVRLALARFQPYSVDGAHLSRVVRADFAQLAPNRAATITTNPTSGGYQFGITVTGVTYAGSSARNAEGILFEDGSSALAEIEALLQKREPSLGDDPDLGWTTIVTKGLDITDLKLEGRWEGNLDLDLIGQLEPNKFRILLREWEWYRSDFDVEDPEVALKPTPARRIVYADSIPLG